MDSVVDALRVSPLGQGLDRPELNQLAARMTPMQLDPHQALVTAGEQGAAAFVVLEGQLQVRAADGTVLDHEGPGALVGEQALLGDGTRTATVVALEPCRLLRVDRALFQELAASSRQRLIEEASDAKTQNRLGRLSQPFQHLLAASERRVFVEGQVVFEEGDPADGLHLVLAGTAEVVTQREGEIVHLSTVYPGRVFGEIATLRGIPRTSTVVARAGLRTAFVTRQAALDLQAQQPDLEAFLRTLLRSYELPRQGALHQRSVFRDGQAGIETVFALNDGRQLTGLRTPDGHYRLVAEGAKPAKELALGSGTTVWLDGDHRIVVLEDRGAYDDIAGLQTLALDGAPLSVKQRRALRKAARAAALQAPDAVICRCLNLDRATLQAAIDQGARTQVALKEATGCGTVCGGCMRATVPAMLQSGAPATAALAKAPAALPRVPRFIPWLGNFRFSQDPAGFQRRGHQRLGPVFAAHLMGVDFVFVQGGPPQHDDLDAQGGCQRLLGARLGPLLEASPTLESRLPSGAAQAVQTAIQSHADGVDALTLASDAVCAALTAAHDADLARLLDGVWDDVSAWGALLPLQTSAARRRVQARDALIERVGIQTAATLVAAHRNARLAVVAGLVDPKATLQDLVITQGTGGVWRLATRPLSIGSAPIPQGALVGSVLDGTGQGTLPDEAFGRRGGLAEQAASLVLDLLRGQGWTATPPRRWAVPIVSGMHQPVGPVFARKG